MKKIKTEMMGLKGSLKRKNSANIHTMKKILKSLLQTQPIGQILKRRTCMDRRAGYSTKTNPVLITLNDEEKTIEQNDRANKTQVSHPF